MPQHWGNCALLSTGQTASCAQIYIHLGEAVPWRWKPSSSSNRRMSSVRAAYRMRSPSYVCTATVATFQQDFWNLTGGLLWNEDPAAGILCWMPCCRKVIKFDRNGVGIPCSNFGQAQASEPAFWAYSRLSIPHSVNQNHWQHEASYGSR